MTDSKKKILIIGLNYFPEKVGVGKYTGELCQYLAGDGGARVRVIASQPYYPQWKIEAGYKNRYRKETHPNLEIYRCPLYVPKDPGIFKRLIHHLSFLMTALPVAIVSCRWKPDSIVVMAPSLFSTPLALLISLCTKAPSFLHIQDFEVEAMFSQEDNSKGKARAFALGLEKMLLKKFDGISTISDKMRLNLHEKGLHSDKTAVFRNWVNLDTFEVRIQEQEKCSQAPGKDDEQTPFTVLYSGNVGEKQGLDIMLDVAKDYNSHDDIVFCIIGAGSSRERLEMRVADEGIKRVQFGDLVPMSELPSMLKRADLHLVLQRSGISDLVLPSKLGAILAVGGQAIVSSEKDSELAVIHENNPGIYELITPENVSELAECIAQYYQRHLQAGRRISANLVAAKYARDNLSDKIVLNNFTTWLTR